jgi:hypothetical protein
MVEFPAVFEFPVVSRLLDILTFPVVYMSPDLNTRSMRFQRKRVHGQVVYGDIVCDFEVVRSSITFPRGGGGRHWCIYV